MKKWTVAAFRAAKGKQKLGCCTAYDACFARLADEAGVPCVLIGDSMGMTMLGYGTTLPVKMEETLSATAAVARAVKLEGGATVCDLIRRMTEAGIPVLAHVGMMPQSVNAYGGFKKQGKTREEAAKVLADAKAVEAAGAFAVTLECVPAELAAEITAALAIPTIGIGAGPVCDAQWLVMHDLLGLNEGHVPAFVKQYAHLAADAKQAFAAYVAEVASGTFPPASSTPPTTSRLQ